MVVNCCCHCRRRKPQRNVKRGREAGVRGSGWSLGCAQLRSPNERPPRLCPQAGGVVLRGAHQLPLGGAVQVLGLQQGRI